MLYLIKLGESPEGAVINVADVNLLDSIMAFLDVPPSLRKYEDFYLLAALVKRAICIVFTRASTSDKVLTVTLHSVAACHLPSFLSTLPSLTRVCSSDYRTIIGRRREIGMSIGKL